jgi:uroporphyrinogen decarboxylase
MTKRERMMTTLTHREPDRVPKGELSIESDIANRLLDSEYPPDYQHFERDWKVREFLNIDFINLGDWPMDQVGTTEKGYPVYKSVYGEEFIFSGLSKHIVKPPLTDIREASSYHVPDINKVSGALIERFRNHTDFYIIGQIGGPVSMLDEAFGMEDFMIYALTNTREIRILSEKIMEFEIAKAKLFIDSGAHAVIVADDIAFNSGVFLPPHVMQEIAYPFYRQAVNEIKKYKQVPVLFHSDGDLNNVMDTIVSVGYDGLQSLQPSAGMDIAQLKHDYGDELCLIGNIDLNYIMTMAPPEEVAATVRKTIDSAAPGGGFILSTCNTLVDAIPTENALAMYRTADEYGVYT